MSEGDYCAVFFDDGTSSKADIAEYERLQGFLEVVHGMVEIQLKSGDPLTVPMAHINSVCRSTEVGREKSHDFEKSLEQEEERGTW